MRDARLEGLLRVTKAEFEELFKQNNVSYVELLSRIKRDSSIKQQLQRESNVFDMIGLRAIMNDDTDCLAVGELIGKNYTILDNRYRDYISNPWSDGYRAIHMDLQLKEDVVIEVQIRTLEMDKHARSLIKKLGDHYWRQTNYKRHL